ncbi:MAG: gamma-glutamyltransferase, partial [Candidatus Marinimicrobia bacterium]|nr:gamma-glutamyltransferase [Candidatus Neomarinimicrobiota bacterium]
MKHQIMCLIIVIAISGCSSQKHSLYVESQSFGIVVSFDKYATEVGKKILEDGGNAIDASVGVGFALAVTHPGAGNLGGGGFMVLRLKDGSRTSIDYREKAPQKASRDMYLDSKGNHLTHLSQEGYLSVGVPGSVAGMLFALEKYGTMSIEQVLKPSYKLAIEGFRVDARFSTLLTFFKDELSKYPSTADIFLKDSLTAYEEGDIFRQPDLAATIDRIIKQGNAGFYSGRTAELFVSTMKKYGGLITKEDLMSYKPVEREPIIGNYRGYDIISMPPSSSGGVILIELLNILEDFDLSSTEPLYIAYLK